MKMVVLVLIAAAVLSLLGPSKNPWCIVIEMEPFIFEEDLCLII